MNNDEFIEATERFHLAFLSEVFGKKINTIYGYRAGQLKIPFEVEYKIKTLNAGIDRITADWFAENK